MGDGLVIRSRAAKAMPEEATFDDLDSIKGSPWDPSADLRDVLPDVPRPILSRDEPPFSLVEERPVPQNMQITHDIIKKFGYTPGCANARNCRAHSQDCRTRIEAASRTDPVYCDRAERAEQRKMDFYANEVERIDRPRRTSLEPSVVSGPPTGETKIPRCDPEGEDHSSVRDVKRARGEPEQDLSGEIPILAVPSGSTPSSSASVPISPGASASSGVKRTYSESTMLPNSPGVSSGSGVEHAHGDSVVNDDDEQPGTRARISALIAGLHDVNAAEDDEIHSGDGITDEWLSSWYLRHI